MAFAETRVPQVCSGLTGSLEEQSEQRILRADNHSNKFELRSQETGKKRHNKL